MGTSALTLITASLTDIGVLQQGSPVSPADAQDCLRRLNRMVSGWQTQYNTVTAIERMVFDLVANQQTYTIGPGGDFDVPRPLTVYGAGLWLNALGSPSSATIARVGAVATVTQVAHGYSVGDEAYITGATQTAYNGLQTVQSVPTANTFTFAVEGTPLTPATGTITTQHVTGQPVEIPRTLLTDDAYEAIQLKNLSNAQFTNVYYNATYPLGTIFLWPRPNTAENQIVLYLMNVFPGFADLNTEYDFPDLPGYAEALQYNLDVRLAVAYARELPATIAELARETMGLIKRSNNKINDLPSDAALLTNDRRGWYNINTGTGG